MEEDLKINMPPTCRCIKCKQVFKIKCNGVYYARVVECGYSQVPRVDFSKKYLLALHDIMFSELLLILIKFGSLA